MYTTPNPRLRGASKNKGQAQKPATTIAIAKTINPKGPESPYGLAVFTYMLP